MVGSLDALGSKITAVRVENVTVYADERLVFRFKNGSEVLVEL